MLTLRRLVLLIATLLVAEAHISASAVWTETLAWSQDGATLAVTRRD